MKIIYLTSSFLLELVMLYSFGNFAMKQDWNLTTRWVALIGLVGGAIVLWGLLAAPKAKKRLKMPYLILFRTFLFGLASYCFFLTGQNTWAIVVVVATVLTQIGSYLTEK